MSTTSTSERQDSETIRQMVANASDEQLAWIVGPDRDFYSKYALRAASEELERRREEQADLAVEPAAFDVAAFALGPVWYFYHGMLGRGVLILFVLLGAYFGLQPVADAAGLPEALWMLAVYLVVGSYCGRYGARDKAESETQARIAARKNRTRGRDRRGNDDAPKESLVEAAVVGCRMAGEQAKELLRVEGIAASLKDEKPTIVRVAAKDLDRAREILKKLLADLDADPDAGCGRQE